MLLCDYFSRRLYFLYLMNFLPSIDGEIGRLFFETTGQNNWDPRNPQSQAIFAMGQVSFFNP